MTRCERRLLSPLQIGLILATALLALLTAPGGLRADDAEPDLSSLKPRFADDSIDFWYTTETGEVIPARMFALYALEDAENAPPPLEEFISQQAGATVEHPWGVSAAFTHIGHTWAAGRPPAFVVNTTGAPYPLTGKQVLDAILIGAEVWRYENLAFTYAGPTNQFVNTFKPDGKYTVSFGFALPPQAIGVAMLWCPGCQGGPIEYDIQFKLGWTGWTYDQLMSTAAHEFGHVAGLGHETAGCGERIGPLMCPSDGSIFPGPDDFEGIRALYGGDGPRMIPQPARYTALMESFAFGKPTIGDLVLAINPATGATCGSATLQFVLGKPAFSFEVFGNFFARPGCPEGTGKVRFFFPKTKQWAIDDAPWEPGGDFVNIAVTTKPAELKYKKRTAGITGE